MLFRTACTVLAYAVCAQQAALLATVSAAAYYLRFQLGFVTTQIGEAVAVAVQTLLGPEMDNTESNTPAAGRAGLIGHLVNASLSLAGGVATELSLTTYWRRDLILAGLTTSAAVHAAAAGIFPPVLLTQVLKGLAYPVSGIIMGGLDWYFTMGVMWIANFRMCRIDSRMGQSGWGQR